MAAVFPDAKDESDTHEAREARREAEQAAIDAGAWLLPAVSSSISPPNANSFAPPPRASLRS